jgi:hypothetical protein
LARDWIRGGADHHGVDDASQASGGKYLDGGCHLGVCVMALLNGKHVRPLILLHF